jgi:hypothetical protein
VQVLTDDVADLPAQLGAVGALEVTGHLALTLHGLEELRAREGSVDVLAVALLADQDVLDVGDLGPAVADRLLPDEEKIAAPRGLEVAGSRLHVRQQVGPVD